MNNAAAASNGKNGNNVFIVGNYPSSRPGFSSAETLISINSRAALLKKKTFNTRLIATLVVAVILLIIGIIVLSIYYVNSKNSKISICTEPECIRSAANLKLSMDTSADPCQDFYNYTCGHWSSEHPNHGWYAHFSNFETIHEKVLIETMAFLNKNATEPEPEPVAQCKQMFAACKDSDSMNELGYAPIFKYLKAVHLPNVPTFFTNVSAVNDTDVEIDWIKPIVYLKKVFAMHQFIGFGIYPDTVNRTNNILYFGVPFAATPLPSPWKTDRKSLKNAKDAIEEEEQETKEQRKKQQAYKRLVKGILKRVLQNATQLPENFEELSEIAASTIWNMTIEILKIQLQNAEDDEYAPYKLTVGKLQNLTDQYVISQGGKPKDIYGAYLKEVFKEVENVTLNYDATDIIYAYPPEVPYLLQVVAYLTTTSDVLIELFLWFQTVNALVINTTNEMREFCSKEAQAFKGNIIRSREMDCSALVIEFMGMAVSYGIADKQFLNNTKPKVQQMLEDIKDAFVARVKELNWMDDKTKQETLEKSKEMISFIGFPEWLLEKKSIEIYYKGLVINQSQHLENMMGIIKQYVDYELNTLNTTNERSWHTDPTTVNAYNYFSDNSITVPMAFLNFPMYHLGLEVLNYAAIGSILGHELTHGFDNAGRKYDKFGNFRQWWTNDTIIKFENITDCFVKQYDNYTVANIKDHIKGQHTLGENLADNGGLNQAYYAYKNYIRRNGQEPQLPGFEHYTSDQMFFIAFGSIWCETPTLESLKQQIDSDVHCPNHIRVTGTLQNSKEFSEAFNCPVGSAMNPNRTRCKLW